MLKSSMIDTFDMLLRPPNFVTSPAIKSCTSITTLLRDLRPFKVPISIRLHSNFIERAYCSRKHFDAMIEDDVNAVCQVLDVECRGSVEVTDGGLVDCAGSHALRSRGKKEHCSNSGCKRRALEDGGAQIGALNSLLY